MGTGGHASQGDQVPWRRASGEHLRHNFLIPVAGTVAGLALGLILGVRDPFAVIGFGLCMFVLGTILQEFARGVLARHRATGAGRSTNSVATVNNRVGWVCRNGWLSYGTSS